MTCSNKSPEKYHPYSISRKFRGERERLDNCSLLSRSNRKFGRLSRRRFRLKQQEEVPRGDKFPLLAPSTKGFAGFSRIVSRAISLPKPNPRPANSTVSRAKPTPDPPPLSFLHFFVHPRFTLIHLLLFTILLLRKIVKERTVQSPDYSNHRYYPRDQIFITFLKQTNSFVPSFTSYLFDPVQL